MDFEYLIKTIIQCAYNVRMQLAQGFLNPYIKKHY